MGFIIAPDGSKWWEPEYRVVERDGWFSPQMHYLVRGRDRWFSLNRDGYQVDPGSWNMEPEDGENMMVLMQTREMADSAISKAKLINVPP